MRKPCGRSWPNSTSDFEPESVKASIYVVGGAAMSLAYGRDSVTADIDAIASHRAIGEEAQAIAKLHGLPEALAQQRV